MNKYAKQARAAAKKRRRFRSCESKVRFETEVDAEKHVSKLTPYRCRYCHGWHLTKPVDQSIAQARGLHRSKEREE